MIEIQQDKMTDTNDNIRITGINRDKTRSSGGEDKRYHVYFELSGIPVQAWITIFEKEWKTLNPDRPQVWDDVDVNNRFLVVHCSLQEVVDKYFPALKKAVDAANKAYRGYAHDAAEEHQHRIDEWTDERKAVDDVAKLLKF